MPSPVARRGGGGEGERGRERPGAGRISDLPHGTVVRRVHAALSLAVDLDVDQIHTLWIDRTRTAAVHLQRGARSTEIRPLAVVTCDRTAHNAQPNARHNGQQNAAVTSIVMGHGVAARGRSWRGGVGPAATHPSPHRAGARSLLSRLRWG